MGNPKNSSPFFRENTDSVLGRILIYSLLFHLVVGIVIVVALFIRPSKKPHIVPIVELIQPIAINSVRQPRSRPVPPPPPEPQAEEVKKELPPEPALEPAVKVVAKKIESEKMPIEKQKPPQKQIEEREPTPEDTVAEDDDWGQEEIVSRAFTASPSEKARIAQYTDRVRLMIEQRFNPIAGQTEHYGKVCTVTFKIHRSGAIIDPEIVSSSGVTFIDGAAMNALKRGRLEQLPTEFRGQYMNLRINLTYNNVD